MSLYRSYRPTHFHDLRGQDHVVEILQSALKTDRSSHAYLFTGPRGTGKTSTARIMARALNCEDLKDQGPCNACESCVAALEERLTDLIEIDAASHGLVDDARSMVEQAKFMPSQAKKKVYIIDEVHMLSKSAFNALLKIVEEPPEHVHFIMATTEAHKVLETIKSRCQRFDFHLSDEEGIGTLLKDVSAKEGMDISPDAFQLIAVHARGSYRDALSLLEQFIGKKKVSEQDVRDVLGLSDAEKTVDFVNALIQKDTTLCLQMVTQTLKEGHDAYQFCQGILQELRVRLVNSQESYAFPLEWVEVFYKALENLKSPLLAELPLELAIYKCHQSVGQVQQVAQSALTPVQLAPTQNEQVVKPEQSTPKKAQDLDVEVKKSIIKEQKQEAQDEKAEVAEENKGKATVTGTFDKDVYIKSIDQASLRTLIKFSKLEFTDGELHIESKTEFEMKKIQMQENFSYLLELLDKHLGGRTKIHVSIGGSTPAPPKTPDGLSSTDLESVF